MEDTATLFPVLNLAKIKKPVEADRRLPTWIAHPTQFPGINLLESGQDIDEFAEYIDEDLRQHLKKNMLIERLFPVQKCLVPSLTLQFKSRLYRRPNDICVSSPTGSGKTLAYAIPIVNHLKQTLFRSLRALVILPSVDLAKQVEKVISQLCSHTTVQCMLAVGDNPATPKNFFTRVHRDDAKDSPESLNSRHCSVLHDRCKEEDTNEEYQSTMDILVSTPGVLVDLMHNCPGFSLKDLEILVIDEADRLVNNLKYDWMNSVERAIFQDSPECPCKSNVLISKPVAKKQRVSYSSITGCTLHHYSTSKPLQKLLFSATLSSDPQILMHLNLFQPRLFIGTRPSITSTKIRHSLGSQASTPSSSPIPQTAVNPRVNTRNELLTSTAIPEQLEEKMFITEAKEKLFVMWYIFHQLKYKKVICFTNQLQTSSKLCKFLNEVHEVRAVEFSSHLKPVTRDKLIHEFQLGKIEVIVSTDLMARGMDVEGVDYVVSYDMPSSEIFYVHRVGRTARAGKKGVAITLVDTKQLVQFKKIVQLAHKMPNSMRLGDVVEEMKVPHCIKKNTDTYELYTKTLENYEDKVELEAKNRRKYKPK